MTKNTASIKETSMPIGLNQWKEAIIDVEDRVMKLDRERARLRMAIRLMKRQVREGAPWPTRTVSKRGR